jgi:hypothetical protein
MTAFAGTVTSKDSITNRGKELNVFRFGAGWARGAAEYTCGADSHEKYTVVTCVLVIERLLHFDAGWREF